MFTCVRGLVHVSHRLLAADLAVSRRLLTGLDTVGSTLVKMVTSFLSAGFFTLN